MARNVGSIKPGKGGGSYKSLTADTPVEPVGEISTLEILRMRADAANPDDTNNLSILGGGRSGQTQTGVYVTDGSVPNIPLANDRDQQIEEAGAKGLVAAVEAHSKTSVTARQLSVLSAAERDEVLDVLKAQDKKPETPIVNEDDEEEKEPRKHNFGDVLSLKAVGGGLGLGAFLFRRHPFRRIWRGLKILWRGTKWLAGKFLRGAKTLLGLDEESKLLRAERELAEAKKATRVANQAEQVLRDEQEAKKLLQAEEALRKPGLQQAEMVAEDAKGLAELRKIEDAAKAAQAAQRAEREAQEVARAARAAADVVKASKLTKVTRTGGFVGLIASFTAVPAAVAALVYKTAPAGQSSQQTFDESMRVAGLVAVPADVRQAWNAGNRIDAADKFLGISDAWNFIKLTVSDPNAAWEKTKQTGRDIAELYDLATAHPETLRAGLLALDKVGQDTALVADARAAALSGDKAGAQAAGLKAVNDALADKPLMDSVNNVSNILQIENYRNGKPFSPLPPQPANSNLVPNQAHNPPRAGLKNGGVVGMNVDAPMPSRPRKLALFGEDYVPQAA